MRARPLSLLLAPLFLGCADRPIDSTAPLNLDFEQGDTGKTPPGWSLDLASSRAGYEAVLTDRDPEQGSLCVEIRGGGSGRGGNLMQIVDARPLRGRRVRLKAAVRAEVQEGGRAQLWLRVDRPGQRIGFFDNSRDRPVVTPAWAHPEIVGEVAPDAVELAFGVVLAHPGTAWVDDVRLEALGPIGEGDEAPEALTESALANLEALVRLTGYVRYFHPSDGVAQADWQSFLINGVREVEDAHSPPELATALAALFKPIAPTVCVFPGGAPDCDAAVIGPGEPRTAWRHYGLAPVSGESLFLSGRIRSDRTGDRELRERLAQIDPKLLDVPPAPHLFETELAGGVSCRIPLVLPAGSAQLRGRGKAPGHGAWPDHWIPTARDRATRLAAIADAWSLFHHFYPYFDEVGVDWSARLGPALQQGALDSDLPSFLATLRSFLAALEDGHLRVSHPQEQRSFQLPVEWDYVEDGIVITAAAEETNGLQPGDRVVAIDGTAAKTVLETFERQAPGATAASRRLWALQELARGDHGETITLGIDGGSGVEHEVVVARSRPYPSPPAAGERPIRILADGIFYLDLGRLTDSAFDKALPQLMAAEGLIFDLREYPTGTATRVLQHLIDRPVVSARWHVPVIWHPAPEQAYYHASDWSLEPSLPHLGARAVFLTGPRAASYAETILSIVEHYGLAEIVGQPTGGTNGNVTYSLLPGGFGVAWTGMKVLKHDGSTHHGIGIHPTVPATATVAGIAAGRDEILEKAVELLRRDQG